MSREKKVEKSLDFYKGILSIFVVSLFGMIAHLYMYIEFIYAKNHRFDSWHTCDALVVGWVCIKDLNELEKF